MAGVGFLFLRGEKEDLWQMDSLHAGKTINNISYTC